MKARLKEIKLYDENDTTYFIDKTKPKSLKDLGFKMPAEPPTKVVSIRLPINLFNKIKAYATNIDMPYQAFIKYVLNKELEKESRKHKHKAA
jgi:predicted DNA binding CopG/RHH family protein